MRHAFLLIATILCCCSLPAQRIILSDEYTQKPYDSSNDPIPQDTSVLECIYTFTEIDSVINEGRTHDLILQIGKRYQKLEDLNNYLADSFVYARHKMLSEGEYFDFLNEHDATYRKTFVRQGNTFTENELLLMMPQAYREALEPMQWVLHPDTAIVCQTLCQKATAAFRGRTWTVWYAPSLPYDAGPWKLQGLPGLILKATDDANLHDFEAISIRAPHFLPILIADDKHWAFVSRKRYRQQELEKAQDLAGALKRTGLMTPSDEALRNKKHGFYSPLELE